MLSADLIKKVDQIFIRSRRRVTDVFSGEFESAFRGRGIEFEEFRDYIPGDDIRQIDWNVTARMNKPYVKVFREEREQTILFLIDLSKSQNFGARRSKKEILTEIAALLAYATIKSHDKVGLILFTERIEKYIPPQKGRAHVWHLIATILTHEPKGVGTNIETAIEFLMHVTRRRTTCFLMSDFWDETFFRTLKVAPYRHEFVAIRVLDPLEKRLPAGGLINFADLETSESFNLDLTKKDQISNLAQEREDQNQELSYQMQSSRIDFLDLTIGEDYVERLLQFFLKREKKR